MLELNKQIHGFTFKEKKYVEEIKSEVYIGEHEKSGARIMYVGADDDNKVFSISFKTVPENDTGVMHILEHSVLNGSDKYPVREPFVELLKSSMQTFLNAMTYPDKTMYPVASCNEKDFENLMDVYLDAVFHPAIYHKKEIFLQEGWHYEGGEKECFRGVVYNEMKGEMSSEDSVLTETLQNTLFPDVCYCKNSGGDPSAIPSLTYEEFIETHKKFYHPENSYIYLYGNMNLEEKLRIMNEGYLSDYDRINIDIKVGLQPDRGFLYKEGKYDSDEGEDKATHYAFGFKAAEFTDHEKLMAVEILLDSIASNNESPLKKALLDQKICEEVYTYLDDQLISPYVCLALKRTENNDEKIKTAVQNILKEIVDNGIDKEVIEANINRAEFKMREAEFGNMPSGLIYCTWAMASWLYGGDPTLLFSYEKEFESIREKAKGDYFERLLEELFLNSPHHAMVKILPDATFSEQKAKDEAERVKTYREKIGEEGLKKAEEELQLLKAMQNSEDSPENLATIPVLDLKYVSPEAEKIPFEVREDKVKVLYHNIETKKILYSMLYFDLAAIPFEDLPYASLAAKLVGRLATNKMSAASVINQIKIQLGSFGMSVGTHAIVGSEEIRADLRVSFSSLESNIENAMALVGELINETDFTNEAEIKKMLLQEKLALENWMVRNGHNVALRRASSYFSMEDAINQQLSGVDYYYFIKKLAEEFDSSVAQKLHNSLAACINKANLVLSVTGDEAILKKTVASMEKLNLPEGERAEGGFTMPVEAKNEGIAVPTDVCFVAKAANIESAETDLCGSMFVLSHILTYDYLWNTIRAKGGAYGTGFTVNLYGDMGIYSYRDPNLKDTIDAFNKTNEYLESFTADNREMTKYIVGAVAASDRPKSPFVKAVRADGDYFRNITQDLRNRIRKEMLETTEEDIRNLAPIIKKLMNENNLCVVSSKSRLEKNAELFENRITIK